MKADSNKNTARKRLIDVRFGRLVVESWSHSDSGRNYFWNCVCDCGNRITTSGNRLTLGKTTSCGCFQKEQAAKRLTSDDITYAGAHQRIARVRGKASTHLCPCGTAADEWSYNGGDPLERIEIRLDSRINRERPVKFSNDVNYYTARCTRCHLVFDKRKD